MTGISSSKLTVPPLHRRLLPRPRLLHALESAANGPVTVLSAPAGHGKTTALAQWVASTDRPTAWITLEEGDDLRRYATHLVSALGDLVGARMAPALAAWRRGGDLEREVLPLIGNALADDGRPLALVLDDLHALRDEPSRRLTRTLLDVVPPSLAVLVAARERPAMRLARRRAAGTLTELSADELRFDRDEVEALLNGVHGLGLDRIDVDLVAERLQGWGAGLALLTAVLAGPRPPATVQAALSGAGPSLHRYLVEELLDTLRPQLRDFLCATSIVPRITASLAAALAAEPQAAALLEELRALNLLTELPGSGGDWTTYGEVLTGVLRTELTLRAPGRVPALHRRAADWLEREGRFDEAVAHRLAAGDDAGLTRLLRTSWRTLVLGRRTARLRAALDRRVARFGRSDALGCALELLCEAFEGADQRTVRPSPGRCAATIPTIRTSARSATCS